MSNVTLTVPLAEEAGIVFGGATVSSYFIGHDPLITALGVGLVALFGVLGYHAVAGNTKAA